MNYLQDWSSRSPKNLSYFAPASSLTYSSLVSAVCLILGVLALTLLDAWPSTIKRFLWEAFVFIIPSQFIYGLELVMSKLRSGKLSRPAFTKEALQSQHSKSEALQRIFVLDGNHFTTTLRRVRTLSGLMPKEFEAGSPAGLGNWDNSCYQNSVIQGLASLPSFIAFIGRSVTQLEANPESPTPTLHALRDFLGDLNDPTSCGKTLWTPSTLKSMNSWQQQDAQEYFSRIIDEVEKEISKSNSQREFKPSLEIESRCGKRQIPARSVRRSPFEGLLAHRVGCKICGYSEGLQLHPFNCLTLNLGTQPEYDIRQCLDEYTAPEDVEGVECVKCTILRVRSQLQQMASTFATTSGRTSENDHSSKLKAIAENRLHVINQVLEEDSLSEPNLMRRCNISANNQVSSTKSRQEVVARAPQNLVIHINRSIFDVYGNKRKNTAIVRFPLLLNLGRWCLGSKSSGEEDARVEIWAPSVSGSLIPSPSQSPFISDRVYELRSVVTHYGRHENGHYVAYRRRPHNVFSTDVEYQSKSAARGGDWYCFNDDSVSSISEDEVLSRGGVFMLFYEAVGAGNTLHSTASAQVVDQSVAIEEQCDELAELDPATVQRDDLALQKDVRAEKSVAGDVSQSSYCTASDEHPPRSLEASKSRASAASCHAQSNTESSFLKTQSIRGVMRTSSGTPPTFLKDRGSSKFSVSHFSVVPAV